MCILLNTFTLIIFFFHLSKGPNTIHTEWADCEYVDVQTMGWKKCSDIFLALFCLDEYHKFIMQILRKYSPTYQNGIYINRPRMNIRLDTIPLHIIHFFIYRCDIF